MLLAAEYDVAIPAAPLVLALVILFGLVGAALVPLAVWWLVRRRDQPDASDDSA